MLGMQDIPLGRPSIKRMLLLQLLACIRHAVYPIICQKRVWKIRRRTTCTGKLKYSLKVILQESARHETTRRNIGHIYYEHADFAEHHVLCCISGPYSMKIDM